MNHRIQIVEDERIVALDLKQNLEQLGFVVVGISSSGPKAIEQARQLQPDLTLMDIHLDGQMKGTEAARVLRDELGIPVVFLTAYAEENTLQSAAESAPYGYLLKPFELRELNASIRMALSCHAAEQATRDQHRRLQMAIDTAKLGVWEWDEQAQRFFTQGHTLLPSLALTEYSDMLPILQLLKDVDRQRLVSLLAEQDAANLLTEVELQNGEAGWIELNARRFTEPGGLKSRVIGVMRDVTDKVSMEVQLRQASAVFQNTAEGIAIVLPDRRIQMANPALLRMTGYALEDLIGQDLDQILHERKHSASFYQQLGLKPNGIWHGEVLCRRQDGSLFPAWEHICSVQDADGQLSHFIIACSDISAIRHAQRELNHMAYHDALTGLANRHLLEEQLAIELEQAEKQGQSVGLIFIDLDGFKLVNDTLGHAAGDRLLQIVSTRIRETIRRHDLAVRLGGDEFFILVPDTSLEHCTQLANRLLAMLEQPVLLANEPVTIGGSLGIAMYPAHGQDGDTLLRAADSAMYAAKQHGKRQFCIYDPHMTDHMRQRMLIEQRLRQAIRSRQLVLHYQPFFSLHSRQLMGFEALVRWQQEDGTLMPPDQFIPIAEECGLINDLGAFVLLEACQVASQWQESHPLPLRVAVNVSARQLMAPGFVRHVGQVLLETGLFPHLLELEVTESTLQVIEDSQRVLSELKALGISIAIDDFGTGYSSMALLQHLPIDRLKIDRSFVRDTPHRSKDTSICRTIAALAHNLMLGITAEGVETEAQATFLQEIGCDTAQGYWFAKPMSSAALADYLASSTS